MKGAAGVLPVDTNSLLAIECPEAEVEAWVERTEKALSGLRRIYPSMVPELEARMKELAEAAPALAAGE